VPLGGTIGGAAGSIDLKRPSDQTSNSSSKKDIITIQSLSTPEKPFSFGYKIIDNHIIDAIKSNPVIYSRDDHGIKVKGLYVGIDFAQAMNEIKSNIIKYKNENTEYENHLIFRQIDVLDGEKGWKIEFLLADRENITMSPDLTFKNNDYISLTTILVDSKGVISEIMFGSSAFNVGENNLQDFVDACGKNFDVDFESSMSMATLGEQSVTSVLFESKSSSGHNVSIYQDIHADLGLGASNIEFGKISANNTLKMRLSKSVSKKDLENQFE
jgi:hypothetical protein